MNEKENISTGQMHAMFFLFRLLGLFTFVAPQKKPLSSGDFLLLFLPFIGLELLFCLPLFWVTKQNISLPTLVKQKSPFAARAIGVLAFLCLCYSGAIGVGRLRLFLSTVLFSETDMLITVVLLISGAFFVAKRGLQAIARSSFVVLIFSVLILTSLVLFTAKDFTVYNTDLPLLHGVSPLLYNGFSAVIRTTEPFCYFFWCNQVKGNAEKGFPWFLVLFGLFASFMLYYIAGVTGIFGENQMFKLYTLTVMAKLGSFERLDDFIIGLWILCTLFRTAFYMLTAAKAVGDAFLCRKKIPLTVAPVLIFGMSLLISSATLTLADTAEGRGNDILYLFSCVLLPLIIGILFRLPTKKEALHA